MPGPISSTVSPLLILLRTATVNVPSGFVFFDNPDKEIGSQVGAVVLLADIFRLSEEEAGGVAAVADLAEFLQPFGPEVIAVTFIPDSIKRRPVGADNRGDIIDPLHPAFDFEGSNAAGDDFRQMFDQAEVFRVEDEGADSSSMTGKYSPGRVSSTSE